MTQGMHESTHGKRWVLFFMLVQYSLDSESQKFGTKVGIGLFKRSRLSTACEICPPSARGVCRRGCGASLFIGFQSTQWLVMRGHIVAYVWKFVQADAHIGNLDVYELLS